MFKTSLYINFLVLFVQVIMAAPLDKSMSKIFISTYPEMSNTPYNIYKLYNKVDGVITIKYFIDPALLKVTYENPYGNTYNVNIATEIEEAITLWQEASKINNKVTIKFKKVEKQNEADTLALLIPGQIKTGPSLVAVGIPMGYKLAKNSLQGYENLAPNFDYTQQTLLLFSLPNIQLRLKQFLSPDFVSMRAKIVSMREYDYAQLLMKRNAIHEISHTLGFLHYYYDNEGYRGPKSTGIKVLKEGLSNIEAPMTDGRTLEYINERYLENDNRPLTYDMIRIDNQVKTTLAMAYNNEGCFTNKKANDQCEVFYHNRSPALNLLPIEYLLLN